MQIWVTYKHVADAVRASHEGVKISAHDCGHAYRVGEMARRIALDEWGNEDIANTAGLAGLCHNADHILLATGQPLSEVGVGALVESWLRTSDLDEITISAIVGAVLGHGGKNDPHDPRILVALKDADRVVNMALDLVMRSALFHQDVPLIDYHYFLSCPMATYHRPGSALKDVAYALEWADPQTDVCVRTKLGLQLATERAVHLKAFLEMVNSQITEDGMRPDPFAT